MTRAPTWRLGIGFLFVPLLSSCDWPIDPDLNPGENVNIRVQMAFTNFHDDVTASWSGQQVSLGVWTADDFTGRTSVTNAALPGSVDVIPPQVVQFPVENDIFPGIWEVSVQAYEDGALFLDVTCTQLDIGGNMIAPGETYTVQVFENGLCEAELGDIDPPAPPDRDAEALDLSAPASAVIGDVVPLAVDIRNNGELLQEIIAVDFRYRPPGGGNAIDIDSVTPLVDPSTTETVAIDWDTTCLAPEGYYLVEATVSVAGDSVANNSQSAVVDLAADREVTISGLNGPANASVGQAGGTLYRFTLANGDSAAETGIDVTVVDAFSSAGTVQRFWVNPLSLDCGESRELAFAYFPSTLVSSAEQGSLTVTATTTAPGDDPADNSASIAVTLQP